MDNFMKELQVDMMAFAFSQVAVQYSDDVHKLILFLR